MENNEQDKSNSHSRPKKGKTTKKGTASKKSKRRTHSAVTPSAPPPPPPPYPYYMPPIAPPPRTARPAIAGVLLIITAILGLLTSCVLFNSVSVFEDSDEDVQFFGMSNRADVTGTVIYEDTGMPAENVRVTIISENLSTTTDPYGHFAIRNVRTGRQEIMVEKVGYNTIILKTFIMPSTGGADDESGGADEDENDDLDNYFEFELTTGEGVINEKGEGALTWLQNFMYGCGTVIIILSLLAIVGGVFAIKRKHFWFAALSGVFGLFTIGFFIGSILAFIALIVLFICRREFRTTPLTPK